MGATPRLRRDRLHDRHRNLAGSRPLVAQKRPEVSGPKSLTERSRHLAQALLTCQLVRAYTWISRVLSLAYWYPGCQDLDLSQCSQDDRREVDPPVKVQIATWSAVGQPVWWVKSASSGSDGYAGPD